MEKDAEAQSELANRRIDYLVTALKGIVGAVPFGSLVAEAIGAVIPKQRMDRMADVVERVAAKLNEVETDVNRLEDRFYSPEFIDVLEEAMLQAARAMSDERREYLANMLVTGLTEPELKHGRLKKLMLLLEDLADEEVIILTYSNLAARSNKTKFFQLHERVLREPAITTGTPHDVREQKALHDAWRRRLVQLGLTMNEHPGPNELAPLGRMLLRYIGAPHDRDVAVM